MPTIYLPERKTIGNLLSMTNPPIRVPDWQRNYSWTNSQVEVFWNDILNFDRRYPDEHIEGQEYFLGSVVLVDNKAWHLLLDGQQRLATSAILISVIRDFLHIYNTDAATRTSHRYLNDFDDASQTSVYKVTLNRYDRDFFKREVLESRMGDYAAPIPTMDSHELIRRAREYFVTRFEEMYEKINNQQASHNWALRIQTVLTLHVSVVAIVTQDEDNAASVFETLNDRGIGLSTPDLVRNLVMRRAQAEQEEEISDLWGQILEAESDVKLKTFLRHYWISHYGDVKTQSLYREIKDFILTNNIDSLTFSRSLRDSSIVYRDILNAQNDNPETATLLSNMGELGASVLYPLVLSALDSVTNENTLRRFLRTLVVAYVRHSVIGRLENSLVEDEVFKLAKSLRANHDVDAAIAALREFAPNDEYFVGAFRNVVIADTGIARYILREIELSKRTTEELELALPPRIHVEHIYPQTPRPGERWPEHSSVLNRLGNLTLLSRRLNTTIKNSPYHEKQPYYLQSELFIAQEAAKYESWSPARINERQNELADIATLVWAFPD
jgi:uncharacterized protein with ParB-like and HNH nuclease domain